MIPIISIVAYSGTGKTTFMVKLIPELKKRGIRLAVIKHDAHDFEIDKEGKDSWRITQAGSDITGLVSEEKAVIMENRHRSIDQILDSITDVDLILTEGYKTGIWPKIMIHRSATGKALPLDPAMCLAVVSDVEIEGAKKQFALDDVKAVADLIVSTMKKRASDKNPLEKVPFLSHISSHTLKALWEEGRVEEVKRGCVVIEAKKQLNHVYIQLSGYSAVYTLTHNGNRKVIFILGKGNLLNDHVVNEHTSSVYCETMEKSKIFVISTKRFVHWMKKDFELTKAVLNVQEWKMWRMSHQLKNTTSSIPMERKLAAKIWKLSRDFGKRNGDGIEIDMNISITFLSDMLGAPRETTSRACKALSEQGLIQIVKKRITILDPEGMMNLYKKGSIDG